MNTLSTRIHSSFQELTETLQLAEMDGHIAQPDGNRIRPMRICCIDEPTHRAVLVENKIETAYRTDLNEVRYYGKLFGLSKEQLSVVGDNLRMIIADRTGGPVPYLVVDPVRYLWLHEKFSENLRGILKDLSSDHKIFLRTETRRLSPLVEWKELSRYATLIFDRPINASRFLEKAEKMNIPLSKIGWEYEYLKYYEHENMKMCPVRYHLTTGVVG